jgi:hypothetical protein
MIGPALIALGLVPETRGTDLAADALDVVDAARAT